MVFTGILPGYITAGLTDARIWFPSIFAPAFMRVLHTVFYVAFGITLAGAILSLLREPLKNEKLEKDKKLLMIW